MNERELSDADLAEIEKRLMRGWVIRPDQMRSLISMARERNWLKQEADKAKQESKED